MPTLPKTRELRYCPAELRAIRNDDGTRTVSGYAAVFNSPSLDLGGWTEMLAPGCFTKSLNSSPDVVLLRDHDNSILLGRTTSRTLTLSQDATGLRFECKLPDTSQANDLAVLIDRKDLSGCSFGFISNLDNWANDEAGNVTRTILDADLFDVSIVSFPAYPDTSLSLRSAPVEIRSKIESRVKPPTEKRDLAACTCDCDPCEAGDCDGCLDPDCTDEFCSCAEKFRNKVHMTVELARHRVGQVAA